MIFGLVGFAIAAMFFYLWITGNKLGWFAGMVVIEGWSLFVRADYPNEGVWTLFLIVLGAVFVSVPIGVRSVIEEARRRRSLPLVTVDWHQFR